jgi:AcrR family transcriptional regulator
MLAAADDAGDAAVDRLEAVLATFARRALQNRRLAWALLAEPVDPLVDAERLAYRERYAQVVAHELQAAIDAGEIPAQDVAFTAAVLVGGCGEALVGPLSSVDNSDRVVAAIQTFVLRAIGAT